MSDKKIKISSDTWEQLQANLQELTRENSELSDKNAALAQEVANLKEEIERLNLSVQDLREALEQAKQDMSAYDTEAQELAARLTKAGQANCDLRQRLAEVKNQLKEANRRYGRASQTIGDLRNANLALRTKNVVYSGALKDLGVL
jgi:Chromosome segregation ATPases